MTRHEHEFRDVDGTPTCACGVLDIGLVRVRPMPPSLRRQYRGQPKTTKAQRARKGIPPWKLR